MTGKASGWSVLENVGFMSNEKLSWTRFGRVFSNAMLLSQELKTSRFRDKFGVEGAVEAIHREKIGNCATSRHFHLCFF